MDVYILNEETMEISEHLTVEDEQGLDAAIGMFREFNDRTKFSMWEAATPANLNYSRWITGGENGPDQLDFEYYYFHNIEAMLREFASRVLVADDAKEVDKLVGKASRQITKIQAR